MHFCFFILFKVAIPVSITYHEKKLKPKAPNTRGKNSVHGNSTSLLLLAGTICFYLLLNF
ncbi:hypothetical protein DA096_10130 [Vibrio rotiferianus]|nr:hypothetical protein DA095_17285 [Vibrio rotiferianus]TMX48280.1 hypothetical protein DA093_17155 [Vibrio rotiferianus]TMX64116.1 hypothetical protein DA096_10130 [Vibrio rotiferianus]